MKRRVIFPDPDIWIHKETAMSQPAAINRPLTDAERQLMNLLAITVVANQSGIPHTVAPCQSCAVAASVLDEFAEQGEVHVHGDAIDCYMSVGPNVKMVHATREWLAYHAEHPEAIDLHRHGRVIEGDR